MADQTATIEGLQEQLAAATKRAETAEADLAVLGDKLEAVETELGEAKASLCAHKASATRAKNKVAVLQKQIAPDIRKLGAMKPAKSDEEVVERVVALAAAIGGVSVLVFSDGKREIRELAPLELQPGAWRETPGGHVLDHEPLLEPGDCERLVMELNGFALLNGEGDQVGYCPMIDPLTIAKNRRYQIPRGTIRF